MEQGHVEQSRANTANTQNEQGWLGRRHGGHEADKGAKSKADLEGTQKELDTALARQTARGEEKKFHPAEDKSIAISTQPSIPDHVVAWIATEANGNLQAQTRMLEAWMDANFP